MANDGTATALRLSVEMAEANFLAAQNALQLYSGEPIPVPPPPPQIPPPDENVDLPAFNNAAFFSSVRQSLFSGSLEQGQVDGINLIVKACVYAQLNNFIHQASYCLASVYHETGRVFQPVEEIGGSSRPYHPWWGRGHIQLTHEENYKNQQTKLGSYPAIVASGLPYQVHDNWDNALDPSVSALICVFGMKDGDFTGKELNDYDIETPSGDPDYDYVEARRIVNGTDRASEIAGYARHFEAAFHTGATPAAL